MSASKELLASVVIPVYNEEKDIGKCLASLLKQSYKNLEIIIVDDGSTDRTKEIVRKFRKVRLIKGKHRGPGVSRNLGTRKARGKILVFVDADMTFDKDYIKNLASPIIAGKSIGTEERMQISSNYENIWNRCWGKYARAYPKGTKKGNIFRAILKKEFLKMGGFNPKYGYADDLTFYFEYGVKSDLVDKAICYHKNPETLKETYKQSRWIGASIQNKMIELPLIKYVSPVFIVIASPLMIPLLSITKCLRNRDFKVFFPWMLIFMSVRYFGTLNGIYRKIYLGKNVR